MLDVKNLPGIMEILKIRKRSRNQGLGRDMQLWGVVLNIVCLQRRSVKRW